MITIITVDLAVAGFGGGCASSCACACACAGSGRAGCSRKDFYGTKLTNKKIKKALNQT